MLAIGGIAVGGGLFAFGSKVMETIGGKITEVTPVRGFCAEIGAATTILVCSRLGLPVSTTHAAVGGVIGVGVARGFDAVNFHVLYEIALYWVLTVPMAAITSMAIFKILQVVIF